jgi:hypothetical protein
MKIERSGKVTITEEGVSVFDFTYNAEGEYIADPLKLGKEAALRWALEKLKEEMWQEGMRNL